MANTFFGLTIGASGLFGANTGINTTAHNIANTETDGYSRQVVELQAATPLRANGPAGMYGTGVDLVSILQKRDMYYDNKFWSNNTINGFYNTQDYYLQNVESYLNEIQLEGFTTTFNTFNDSLQEISKNPSDLTVRTEVTNYAESFCEYFNFISESLHSIQEDANFEIKNQVEKINSLGTQIAGLTKQINALEITGGKANDLRDARALLVDKLSSICNISVSEKVVGEESVGVTSYTVKIGESLLVDTYRSFSMEIHPREEKVNMNDLDGLYEVTWDNGQTFDALKAGGTIQALFEVRDGNNAASFRGKTSGNTGEEFVTVTGTNINSVDLLNIPRQGVITIGNTDYTYSGFGVKVNEDGNFEYEFSLTSPLKKDAEDTEVAIGKSIKYKGIPYYMEQMNEFIRTFSRRFNEIHRTGQDLNGNEGIDFFNATDKVSGENYIFEQSPKNEEDGFLFTSKSGEYAPDDDEENYGSYYLMTCENARINEKIFSDPSLIAVASNITDGIDNSDRVLQLIALADDKSMFKRGNPGGFLQTLVAELGIDAKKASGFAKNQEDILQNIGNQRLSVMGVDTEEESMNLVRFQNAYNLSSKVISTMNQLYDKLINEMGV